MTTKVIGEGGRNNTDVGRLADLNKRIFDFI